ncbi:MAG: sugar ABC transporter ATP-binding protein [Nocardioidaceae bacterium]
MNQAPSSATPAIRFDRVSKTFGPTHALRSVTFDVAPGSIHALIGLNGSGKSTLVKVLAGYHSADEGVISTGQVAFVHQDLGLLPTMTVLENFAIGRDMAMRLGQIDWRAEATRAAEALDEFGLAHTVHEQLASLPLAQQAIIACARALDRSRDSAIDALVLDEPTSALPSNEIDLLADAMKVYARRGLGIVFITHRLQEVRDLADTVTVLRNGAQVHTGPTADLSIPDMVRLMVGDAPTSIEPDWEPPERTGDPILRGTGITSSTLDGIDLGVHRGEIVGAFGMVGSGLEQLGSIMAGRQAPDEGSVEVDGHRLAPGSRDARHVGYVPSDRPRRGVLPGLSVRENISIRSLRSILGWRGISRRAEADLARRWTEELSVKPRDPDVPILTLSGGNQQKAILARWLSIAPKAIIAEEPTQGIDVWAKQDILRRLRAAASEGTAVLLTAVEPEEILDFCDRVVVLRAGKVVLDSPRTDISITDILSAMH